MVLELPSRISLGSERALEMAAQAQQRTRTSTRQEKHAAGNAPPQRLKIQTTDAINQLKNEELEPQQGLSMNHRAAYDPWVIPELPYFCVEQCGTRNDCPPTTNMFAYVCLAVATLLRNVIVHVSYTTYQPT